MVRAERLTDQPKDGFAVSAVGQTRRGVANNSRSLLVRLCKKCGLTAVLSIPLLRKPPAQNCKKWRRDGIQNAYDDIEFKLTSHQSR